MRDSERIGADHQSVAANQSFGEEPVVLRGTGKREVRQPTFLVACLVGLLALASAGCVIVETFQADEEAQRSQANESRFDRAREGKGSGFVPEVTGDCDTDLAAIDEVREIRQEHGLDGPEQVALQQLVEASADCPDAEG